LQERSDESCRGQQADTQGEDVRGRNGSADTLESFVAATQLRSPPEQAGVTDACDSHRLGSGALKGMQNE
jgi:hypothetical protein